MGKTILVCLSLMAVLLFLIAGCKTVEEQEEASATEEEQAVAGQAVKTIVLSDKFCGENLKCKQAYNACITRNCGSLKSTKTSVYNKCVTDCVGKAKKILVLAIKPICVDDDQSYEGAEGESYDGSLFMYGVVTTNVKEDGTVGKEASGKGDSCKDKSTLIEGKCMGTSPLFKEVNCAEAGGTEISGYESVCEEGICALEPKS